MKPKIAPFAALTFRDFRILWSGVFLSRIGTEMQIVAINWHVYQLTGSALSLGVLGLTRFIALFCSAPFGGIMADKVDRKKTIIVTHIILTALSLILTTITMQGVISPLLIYIIIASQAIVMSFDTPAHQSLLPLLVPQKYFLNASGLHTIMRQSAILIGPAIGGFVIAYLGVSGVYGINTISYVAVIIAMLLIRPTKQNIASTISFNFSTLKTGYSFVKKTPIIYSTMLVDFFATFFSSATVLLPIFAKDILHVGPQGLGLLYAAPAVGGIVAGLLFSAIGTVKKQGKLIILAVCLYGVGTILFGLSRSFYLSLFFLTFIGAGDMISTIIRTAIRQINTPDHLRGRMVSINMLFFMGGPQLGEAEAGLLAFLFGAPTSVVFGGVATIVAVLLLAVKIKDFREYQGDENVIESQK